MKYKNLLKQLKIRNSKQYDYQIASNEELQTLELSVPPTQIESIKKTVFNHFNADPFVPLTELVGNIEYDDFQANVFRNFWTDILRYLSDHNHMVVGVLIKEIFMILDLETPKKSTIFLLGTSNVGKSARSLSFA